METVTSNLLLSLYPSIMCILKFTATQKGCISGKKITPFTLFVLLSYPNILSVFLSLHPH